MTWKAGYRDKKKPSNCKCKHPQITHYTQQGNCIYPDCKCVQFKPGGRPEFRNERSYCKLNHSHDSNLETKTCLDFQYLKAAHEIRDFEYHKVLPLFGPSGKPVATYEIDFIVHHNDGITEYVECKGAHLMTMQPWPLKLALLQDAHRNDPKFTFRVIKG